MFNIQNNNEKPIDLLVVETKNNIVKVANESNLPLSILELIFKDIYGQISSQLNTKLPILADEYNKSLKEEEE